MNKSGSGLTHFTEYHSDEMRLFSGGLRTGGRDLRIDAAMGDKRQHDKMSYSRGVIYHSRSPNTQYLNFHYLYGGSKRFFFDRFLYQTVYKRVVRPMWLPGLLAFSCKLNSPGDRNASLRQQSLRLLLLLRLSAARVIMLGFIFDNRKKKLLSPV